MTDHDDDLLLWLDLETTGSDVDHDCIIEVGCILTDADLHEIAATSVLVKPTDEGLGRMMRNVVVRGMHEANGLLALVDHATAAAVQPHTASAALIKWLEDNGGKRGRVVLAGSGVGHFDRKFLDRYMPQFSRFLRYWCIDVGVLRRSWRMWTGVDLSDANEDKTHRALDDARCHLEEARMFRNVWRAFINPHGVKR